MKTDARQFEGAEGKLLCSQMDSEMCEESSENVHNQDNSCTKPDSKDIDDKNDMVIEICYFLFVRILYVLDVHI